MEIFVEKSPSNASRMGIFTRSIVAFRGERGSYTDVSPLSMLGTVHLTSISGLFTLLTSQLFIV